MLHSVPAVYSTATSRPQTLTSRRRSFSRMNLDRSGTPRSGTLLSSRETSTTLPESMANSSKTVLIEAGNVTIVLHCCRVEASIRNRPNWGIRK
ncbi:uncharacterized protein LOC128093434 isoform X3 [Culex pipiens pallens]|uniref:uncharacterized protein LOC128093434 isoform X3 n=1 Tax=Culex pipiens pallens TaxID=42434 RepID=UPI0022AB3821|nr:uncharacterized protein LOC128093434 isoform X3 [Culex pipiens pallens]